MQSHDDSDAKKAALTGLSALARSLTERGENRITAGTPGERPLREWEAHGVMVRQMPDDVYALRISIGEATSIGEGAYCVYRGNQQAILELLRRALKALEEAGP